jgi:hypothetical protein
MIFAEFMLLGNVKLGSTTNQFNHRLRMNLVLSL